MFERIGIELAHCNFCGTYGRAAVLFSESGREAHDVTACERCLRAAGKAAELLKTIRDAKSPKAKKAPSKTRKPATSHPRPKTGHPEPVSTGALQGDGPLDDLSL